MRKVFLGIIIIVLIFISFLFVLSVSSFINLLNSQDSDKSSLNNFLESNGTDTLVEPKVKVTKVIDGLTNPWDITFINKDFFYYSQRIGDIRAHNLKTDEDFLLIHTQANVANEGGLLGLAADNDFNNNHYLYSCMNVERDGSKKIILVKYQISADLKEIINSKEIISDMPSNESQRHSGCRIAISFDGIIWVGTGDTAHGEFPQDPKNLGGKVLRIDKDGNGVSGNLTEPYDSRIFSYGHRNIQGIVLFNEPVNGVYGLTAEHGPDKDDEVNLLKLGNFGWDPIGSEYNESVPMTDTDKYPDAIPAIWSSGDPTDAISGMTIVKGNQWKSWNGSILVAVLKNKHIRLQTYGKDWKIVRDDELFKNEYGRIRTIAQSPSGDLFFLTDNGNGQDSIQKISPE